MKEKIKTFFSKYGYAIVLTVSVLLMDFATYYIVPFIGRYFEVRNLSIIGFDDKIPLVKIFFIPYLLSYPFWFFIPIVAGKNKKRLCDWFIAVAISFFVVAIFYCFLPTTIERPVDEMLASDSFVDRFIGNLYMIDGGYEASCCFPSIHCLLSLFCYIAVRRQKNIHISIRIGTFIMMVLILLSTQFTKQHYIVDMIASIVIAELTFFICKKFNLGRGLFNLIEKIENKIKKTGGATAVAEVSDVPNDAEIAINEVSDATNAEVSEANDDADTADKH